MEWNGICRAECHRRRLRHRRSLIMAPIYSKTIIKSLLILGKTIKLTALTSSACEACLRMVRTRSQLLASPNYVIPFSLREKECNARAHPDKIHIIRKNPFFRSMGSWKSSDKNACTTDDPVILIHGKRVKIVNNHNITPLQACLDGERTVLCGISLLHIGPKKRCNS